MVRSVESVRKNCHVVRGRGIRVGFYRRGRIGVWMGVVRGGLRLFEGCCWRSSVANTPTYEVQPRSGIASSEICAPLSLRSE